MEFFLSLNTPKSLLDIIDKEITAFLKENKSVDSHKTTLTGVNDYNETEAESNKTN